MAEAVVLGIQSQELARASVMYSDLELAWQLQLNEALAESAAMSGVESHELASHEGTAAHRDDRAGGGERDRAIACAEQTGEILRREQVLIDLEKALKARNDVALELQQRLHDEDVARMISEIPEAEWENDGDNFEKPFKRRASAGEDGQRACKLYFAKTREDPGYVGIGWALTDASGHVLYRQNQMLGIGVSSYAADYTALISGLAYARSVGARNIAAHGDSILVCNQFAGIWRARSPAQVKFLEQVKEHEKELDHLAISYVSKNKGKTKNNNSFVINLAKQAIQAHIAKLQKDGPPREEEVREDCPICFEKMRLVEMFSVKNCMHKFCLNCLSKHVDVQVKQNLVPVRCPVECTSYLELEQCQPYLPPKLLDAFARRLTEASVPETDRVYCPFPNCSALMSKGGLNVSKLGSSSNHPHASAIGRCECMECHRLFCVECRVPWHADLSCMEYQNLPPDERDAEDVKLYQLARNEKWQRCKKCKYVIELNTGCYHMTCKCGYQFCYTCGAEWKNKEATCKCKLWDENNIINDEDIEVDYHDDDDDSDADYDYDSELEDMPHDMHYKTRLCRHWANGHCWTGEACRFAHGQAELRMPRAGGQF